MRELTVNLTNHSYKIIIECGVINKLASYIKTVYKNDKIFIISDDKVSKLYLNKVIDS